MAANRVKYLAVVGLPIVVDGMPVLTCNGANLFARKSKSWMRSYIGHSGCRPAHFASFKMPVSFWIGLKCVDAFLERFDACRRFLEGFPDRRFVEDFQNV